MGLFYHFNGTLSINIKKMPFRFCNTSAAPSKKRTHQIGITQNDVSNFFFKYLNIYNGIAVLGNYMLLMTDL